MSVISARVRSPRLGHRRRCSRPARGRGQGRHEGAGALLDVHDQPVEPRGELLRQDRRGDQVEGFHRAGHVADRVEAPVGRGESAVWPMIAQPTPRDDPPERRAPASRHSPECCRACPASRRCGRGRARNHRHVAAAGRHHGREGPGSPYPRPAGGMLVEHRTGQGPGEDAAGLPPWPGSAPPAPAAPSPRKNTAIAKAAACPSPTRAVPGRPGRRRGSPRGSRDWPSRLAPDRLLGEPHPSELPQPCISAPNRLLAPSRKVFWVIPARPHDPIGQGHVGRGVGDACAGRRRP